MLSQALCREEHRNVCREFKWRAFTCLISDRIESLANALHTERRRYGDVAEATYAYAGYDARYARIPSEKVKR